MIFVAIDMQSKEQSLPSFDFEKQIERAKWFKEDLDKGEGWSEAYKTPASTYWIKTFPGEEVPIKILFTYDMPMPAEKFLQLLDPSNGESRHRWDDGFVDHEILEAFDDGSFVTYVRSANPWPLSDRSFVLHYSPIKAIDWYGKQAFITVQENATHPSKPEGEDGCIRVYNGGNFFIAIPDENEPEVSCKVFSLSNNLFKGCFPSMQEDEHEVSCTGLPLLLNNLFKGCLSSIVEFLMAKLVPRGFDKLRVNMNKGYKMLYAKE